MSYLDLIGGLYLYPRKYARILAFSERSFIEPFITIAIIEGVKGLDFTLLLIPFTSFIIDFIPGFKSFSDIAISSLLTILPTVFIVSGFLTWIVGSILIHVLSLLFGGSGEFTLTFRVYGYTWVYDVIVLLPVYIAVYSPIGGIAGIVLLSVVSYILKLYFMSGAVSEVYGLTSLRSIIAVLISTIITPVVWMTVIPPFFSLI